MSLFKIQAAILHFLFDNVLRSNVLRSNKQALKKPLFNNTRQYNIQSLIKLYFLTLFVLINLRTLAVLLVLGLPNNVLDTFPISSKGFFICTNPLWDTTYHSVCYTISGALGHWVHQARLIQEPTTPWADTLPLSYLKKTRSVLTNCTSGTNPAVMAAFSLIKYH